MNRRRLRERAGAVLGGLAWLAFATVSHGRAEVSPAAPVETRTGNVLTWVVTLPTTAVASVLVRSLRDRGVPVNFIAFDRERPVNLPSRGLSVAAVLESLVRQDRAYGFVLVRGRIVIHPRDPKFFRLVTVPREAFTGIPQPEAARRYSLWLRGHVTGFASWAVPRPASTRENASAPSVTLSPRATVLDHFVEILGPDPSLTFTVSRGPPGGPRFGLERVSSP